jgi:ABC-type dipeptide/oligopeptide/nickel transport system, ATPase component
VAILEKIVFKNLSVGGTCNLFHHGIAQDCLQNNSFEFCVGNLYGIIGEFGDGGAALSCGLTGNADFYEGRIYIDDEEETISNIIKKSWYIGYDLYGSQKTLKRKTIKEQIRDGIRANHCDLSVETIQNMFYVSEERVGRSIKKVSGERWKASIAIGYAYGKKIFCYPWMNSRDVEHLREQMIKNIRTLVENECVIVLPTTKEENIKKVSEKYTIINLN